MHAFDLNKVAGRSITVRRAVEGEKITTSMRRSSP